MIKKKNILIFSFVRLCMHMVVEKFTLFCEDTVRTLIFMSLFMKMYKMQHVSAWDELLCNALCEGPLYMEHERGENNS